jgi:RNA-directed DNA polymerase
MTETSSSTTVSTRLQRIAELARNAPTMAFTTLAHNIDVELLRKACERTRRDGAPGVDGQTADEYGLSLEENLRRLLDRLKSGTYRAPPVRRAYIPKADGQSRPIGIPTYEDKILQRAVTMVLSSVYEQEFVDWSYGFRPGRSQHQALDALWKGMTMMGGGWVLEVDIASFFDTVHHGHLRTFLEQRVRDGVLRRMIDKWLNAGVLEEGVHVHPVAGTPQGGVISPLLANIYLHEVLDRWFETEVKPRLNGRVVTVRFADDVVMVFSSEADARRVLAALPKRFGRFGLTLHPTKTRLLDCRRPNRRPPAGSTDGPGTFNLLGFTHYWGKSGRTGKWTLMRRTMASRFTRALKVIARWCQWHRHDSVAEQHKSLSRKVEGHYGYYGITGNVRALIRFVAEVERVWRKWLDRRSQRARMTWSTFERLRQRYRLPKPRVVHSVYRRSEAAL